MRKRPKLTQGSKIEYNGKRYEVLSNPDPTRVQLRNIDSQEELSTDLLSLVSSDAFAFLTTGGNKSENNYYPLFWDSLDSEQQRKALETQAHFCEVKTGYKNPLLPSANEPHELYTADKNLTERIIAKAEELGISQRHCWRSYTNWEKQGIRALIDKRETRKFQPFLKVDDAIKTALEKIIGDLADRSTARLKRIRHELKTELARHSKTRDLTIPSEKTLNQMIRFYTAGQSYFGKSKARREKASRPKPTFRQVSVSRPGEKVLIDTKVLDIFVMNPETMDWVQVQLTIALDLYSRSIVAWRFTPISTKAVDVSLLLADVLRPKPMRVGWPKSLQWPYVGVPESIVLPLQEDLGTSLGIAGIPLVYPQTIVADNARINISKTFEDALQMLEISLELARPATPTDKAHIERVFLTIKDSFEANYQGYKGGDINERGKDVEHEDLMFFEELDERFARWVATVYQRRKHRGAKLAEIAEIAELRLDFSPNELYDEGIIKAGFVYFPISPDIYFDLLDTHWVSIQPYGINFKGLVYNSPYLDPYRAHPSPYDSKKWPIRYDPRDLSEIYFWDIQEQKWIVLQRMGAISKDRAFSDLALIYAKSRLLARGADTRDSITLERELEFVFGEIDSDTLPKKMKRRLLAKEAIAVEQAKRDRQIARDNLNITVQPERDLAATDRPSPTFDLWSSPEESNEVIVPKIYRLAREKDSD